MNTSKQQFWERFRKRYYAFPALELALDLSRMNFADRFFDDMEPRIRKAFSSMRELESGAIANPDENRMVGHYWLRNPVLAPTSEIRAEIVNSVAAIKSFAAQVHAGTVRGAGGEFKNLLLIGIGGSALGPQFVAHALGHPVTDKLRLHTFDNTDPDGMERVLAGIGNGLGETLCVVVSKSGGTKETRNGMLEANAAYLQAGLEFGKHAVAVTQAGSELDRYATQHNWITHFPMWDWVGGRTSELSAVGLLPAALQGFDVDSMLEGAKACDAVTRLPDYVANPSALLALAWFHSGNGNGTKNMVVLPYKDRLELFSKYLQQLIMESLGKEKDLDGNVVHQGICVFGNKGSTDQHAYVQQLRDGIENFFVAFIEVLKDQERDGIEVEQDVTSGDFLNGFLLGTRQALFEKGRESLTITIQEISPFSIGVLIALFERAVGYYASLINVNAYHQPGVEAGKKAAARVIDVQLKALRFLRAANGTGFTAAEIAAGIGLSDEKETILKVCEHLAANPSRRIQKILGETALEATYRSI